MGFNNSPSPGFKWRPKLELWTDGQNNEFNLETFEARSYRHWVYVCKIKGKIVFNAYKYSHTTQSHQSNMRKLLEQLEIKIDVEVYQRESLSNFKSNALPHLYETLFQLEIKTPRVRKDKIKEHTDSIIGVKESIATCRALGAKFTRAQTKELKKAVSDRDANRLEHARKERAEVKAKREALKPDLTNLEAISLDFFENVNDLDEVELKLNQKDEVSNVA